MAEKTRTETLVTLKAHYKTVKATAEAMGVSKTTVRRWLRDGVPDHSELWPNAVARPDDPLQQDAIAEGCLSALSHWAASLEAKG